MLETKFLCPECKAPLKVVDADADLLRCPRCGRDYTFNLRGELVPLEEVFEEVY